MPELSFLGLVRPKMKMMSLLTPPSCGESLMLTSFSFLVNYPFKLPAVYHVTSVALSAVLDFDQQVSVSP